MTLEELLAALAVKENFTEKGAAVAAAAVEALTNLQTEVGKKNSEAKNLRTRLKDAESLAESAKARMKKLADHVGIDEDEEDLDGVLEARKKTKGKGDPEVEERIRRLEAKAAKDKADFEKLLSTERTKRHDALKTQAVVSALVAGKVTKPELLAGLLTGKVKIGDDDSLTYVEDDGKEVSLSEGIASWIKGNPEFVASGQTPGAGSTSGGADTTGSFGKDLAKTVAPQNVENPYFK